MFFVAIDHAEDVRGNHRDLVSGLLVTGRTGPELRGLATRCGITFFKPPNSLMRRV